MNYKNISFGWILFVSLLIAVPALGISLGVSVANDESPGQYDIYFRNMIRGGYAERDIVISTGPGTEILTGKIFADDSLKNWIKFDQDNFTIYPSSQVRVKAVVQLPEDISNGMYNGLITVRSFPKPANSSDGSASSAITAAVALKTAIEVTGEQIVKGRVTGISKRSDAEQGLPIEFIIGIKNEGNVRITPRIEVKILDKDQTAVLKNFVFNNQEVLPSVSKDVIAKIPSTDLKVGQYWANIKVSLDGIALDEKNIMFEIFEKGTLRITGELLKIQNNPWSFIGDVVKIEANFRNTGELITSAKLVGEIKKEDRIIKTFETEELDVSAGKEISLIYYFKPEEAGRFTVSGYVLYSKKITETKESIINVNPREGSALTGGAAGVAGGVSSSSLIFLLVLILAVAGIVIYKKFSKPKSGFKK